MFSVSPTFQNLIKCPNIRYFESLLSRIDTFPARPSYADSQSFSSMLSFVFFFTQIHLNYTFVQTLFFLMYIISLFQCQASNLEGFITCFQCQYGQSERKMLPVNKTAKKRKKIQLIFVGRASLPWALMKAENAARMCTRTYTNKHIHC